MKWTWQSEIRRSEQVLVIDEIRQLGSGRWRLIWYGAIERNPHVPSEPTFQAIFCRIKDGWEGKLSENEAIDKNNPKIVSIGVGQFPGICLGTIWQDGKQISRSIYKLKAFDLNIDESSVKLLKSSWKTLDGEEFYIPMQDYFIPREGLGSHCLRVAHNGDPEGIIIPVMEVIRFYYGNSTVLSKAVFNGDFVDAKKTLIFPEPFNLKEGRLVLARRRHVYDNDCWTIGRILGDVTALKGARLIYDSTVVDSLNAYPIHPKTLFPFKGNTSIKAKCLQVGSKKKRWLVIAMELCSGPFPYKDLEILDPAASANPDTDIPPKDKKRFKWRPKETQHPRDKNSDFQSKDEPTGDATPVVFNLHKECFLAIKGKIPLKPEKDKNTHKAANNPIRDPFKPSKLGTGDGVNRPSDVGPGSMNNRGNRDALPVTFNSFKEMVEILNGFEGVNASLHRFNGSEGLIPAFAVKVVRWFKWCYLNFEEKRLRQFMVADIACAGKNYCLIEIERKNGREGMAGGDAYRAEIIYRSDCQPLESREILHLVKELSQPGVLGRMRHLKMFPEGVYRLGIGIKHTWKTPMDYAKKVFSLIKKTSV